MNAITLHTLDFDYSSLDRADIAASTRTKYKSAITALLLAGVNVWDTNALADYAASLPLTGRSHLKSALKIVTEGELNRIKAQATPDNVHAIQAIVMRVEAMHKSIHTKKTKGEKAHTWLSREQVEQITSLPDRTTPTGRRDWIVLSVLLGAGLRRDELVNLTWDALIQQPTKTGTRDVLSITGKGSKGRVIPISRKLSEGLREWRKESGDRVVDLSEIGIFELVRKYGAMIGVSLAPHDCRRTYAMIGYVSNVPLEQISKLLGHASVETTMRYLNIKLDLETTISDFVSLGGD